MEGENREAATSRPKHKRKVAREKGMVLTLVLVLASSRFHGETKSFNACVFIASRATPGFIALLGNLSYGATEVFGATATGVAEGSWDRCSRRLPPRPLLKFPIFEPSDRLPEVIVTQGSIIYTY